jgi:hypothetical protein
MNYEFLSRFCHKVAIFGWQRGMVDFGKPKDLLSQLTGKGRAIELYFNDIQENIILRLESIDGIEIELENKAGMEFSLFKDLDLITIYEKITKEFPILIPQVMQLDAKMEEYFRIKAIKVPEIE